MAGISTDFNTLTPRKRLYLKAVTEGKSKAEAKRIAQYSPNYSPSQIETPQLKAQFARLVRQFAPAHKIAQVIADGLDAKETKFFQHEGKVVETHDVINYAERRQYAKLAGEFGQYVEAEKGAEVNVAVGFTLINGVTRPK